MKRVIKHITLFILFAMCSLASFAQNNTVRVNARTDSTVILIGNQTHIHLSVMYDNKSGPVKVQWPVISDSLISKVRVVSKSKIDTVIGDSSHPTVQRQVQDIVITSFDSGYYAIPPFQFVINGDTAHPLLTDPTLLQVQTVAVDTTKAYRDIKAPMQVPFSLFELLPYVGWGLAGLAVLAVIIYLIVQSTKKKKPVVEAPKAPPVEPHIQALRDLEELALKKLWQEGKVKEYHSGITDILRTYLWGRFGVDALEMTTDEIVYALRRVEISNELKNKLKQILILADLVKFAKEQPLPTENENSLSKAIDFVNFTSPEPPPVKIEEPQPTPVTPEPAPTEQPKQENPHEAYLPKQDNNPRTQ